MQSCNCQLPWQMPPNNVIWWRLKLGIMQKFKGKSLKHSCECLGPHFACINMDLPGQPRPHQKVPGSGRSHPLTSKAVSLTSQTRCFERQDRWSLMEWFWGTHVGGGHHMLWIRASHHSREVSCSRIGAQENVKCYWQNMLIMSGMMLQTPYETSGFLIAIHNWWT